MFGGRRIAEESGGIRWASEKFFEILDRHRFDSSRELEGEEGGKKILRRKSFFEERRKSLFAKKEKLTLNGEEDGDEEVYLNILKWSENYFLVLMSTAEKVI